MVDVVLLDGQQFAAGVSGNSDLLIDGGTVANALEHHGARDHQLYRTIQVAGACCGE